MNEIRGVYNQYILPVFEKKDAETIARKKEQFRKDQKTKEDRKKIDAYQKKVMETIKKTINGNYLLTDYLTAKGPLEADKWVVKIQLDRDLYAEISHDIVPSFNAMGLGIEIDDTNFINSEIILTIWIDESLKPKLDEQRTLTNRGWPWNRLEQSILQGRIKKVEDMKFESLKAKIFDCMKQDLSKNDLELELKEDLSARVFKRVQDHYNKQNIFLEVSFGKTKEKGKEKGEGPAKTPLKIIIHDRSTSRE